MKNNLLIRIVENLYIQIVLGFIVSLIGSVVLFTVSIGSLIKFSGFCLGFLGCSSGDNSPITLAISVISTILTFTFPVFIWFKLNRYGRLKRSGTKVKTGTLILFATSLLWFYLGLTIRAKIQVAYKDYRSVRDPCILKSGLNKRTYANITNEYECKNGVYDGFLKTFDSKGNLTYEVYYNKGTKEGPEIFYNEDGSTNLYVINELGKSKQIYYQTAETYLNEKLGRFDLESQKFYCEHRQEYRLKNYSYSCSGNLIEGEFIQSFNGGNLALKAVVRNGVLNGIYEEYRDGIVHQHLEFSNGRLHGRVFQNFVGGSGRVEYGGQYVNGLQEGVFRRYNYKGTLESEVVFEKGKIREIR